MKKCDGLVLNVAALFVFIRDIASVVGKYKKTCAG
jgi:hypothetical protein